MALKSTVTAGDEILISGNGGGMRTYTVNDTSDAAIARSTNGLGRQITYREVTDLYVWRWVGLTQLAAETYYAAHLNDSTIGHQVGISFYCDSIQLKSYTLDRSSEYMQVYKVQEIDIPDTQAAPPAQP